MRQKIPIIPFMGIRFLAITRPFLANWAEIFYGNSRGYYLPIGYKEFWLKALIAIFDFWVLLGPKKGRGPQIPIWFWDLETQPNI